MSQKDTCIRCGVETNHDKDSNIEYRNFYIEGAGQLCKECYMEFFPKKVYDEEEE